MPTGRAGGDERDPTPVLQHGQRDMRGELWRHRDRVELAMIPGRLVDFAATATASSVRRSPEASLDACKGKPLGQMHFPVRHLQCRIARQAGE